MRARGGVGRRFWRRTVWRRALSPALVSLLLVSCAVAPAQGAEPTPVIATAGASRPTVRVATAAAIATPPGGRTAAVTPTRDGMANPAMLPTATVPVDVTRAPDPPGDCALGMGLRRETVPVVVRHEQALGFVMCATVGLAEQHFPEMEGAIRVLGAPSLSALRLKAEGAAVRGVPYDALAYGLETSKSTPEEEWRDPVRATERARALADEYGKLLVMGPGFRLMTRNWDAYPAMAALTDVWVLQTQQLQRVPPGQTYRQEVERVITQIRSGNPGITIWAQITLPPDRAPNADEWLAYHDAIADLVSGRTYIGAYTWEANDPEQMVEAIDRIVASVCAGP